MTGHTIAVRGQVETIDIFPTLIGLTRLPPLPKCAGIDQPPTILCLQGESYASEFLLAGLEAGEENNGVSTVQLAKQFAFSQWPFTNLPGVFPKNLTGLRQGYTVRSATGYRYTTYVPYSTTTFVGNWTAALGDEELYDYNRDKWETTSFAAVANYSKIKAELRAVLLRQYTGGM